MNLFSEAKKILDKDGKVNPLGPYGKQKLTGREISTYFRRNKVNDATIKKAVEVALDLGGADTIARQEIKKFYGDKVLKSKEVQNALKYANESFTYNQSLNQISEENLVEKNLMPDIQKIVNTKGAKKVGGIMVDMFTASMINQIYNKVNDQNKKKMEKSNISTLVDLAQRMMQKSENDPIKEETLTEGTWEVPDSYPKLVKLNKFLSQKANFKDAQSVHRWHVQADAYFGDDSFSDDIDAYKTTLKGGERSFYDRGSLHSKEYLDRMKKYNKIKAGTDLRDVLEKQLSDWTGGVLKFKNHEIVQMPRDWYMKDNPNEKDDKSPVKAKLESVDYHAKVIVEKFKRGKGRLKFKKSPPIKVEGNAVSPAQQAAIAISKKEKGEKPKNEDAVAKAKLTLKHTQDMQKLKDKQAREKESMSESDMQKVDDAPKNKWKALGFSQHPHKGFEDERLPQDMRDFRKKAKTPSQMRVEDAYRAMWEDGQKYAPELVEVTDKEINAMKQLSKDAEKIKKGFQKITKMGDRELQSGKYNKEYEDILKMQQSVLSLIGKLSNQKIINKESLEEKLSKADLKMIDMMYDKKGKLTDVGKAVMNYKPGDNIRKIVQNLNNKK